jgi:hypothetical protein
VEVTSDETSQIAYLIVSRNEKWTRVKEIRDDEKVCK